MAERVAAFAAYRLKPGPFPKKGERCRTHRPISDAAARLQAVILLPA
jgi:hypothetical protein